MWNGILNSTNLTGLQQTLEFTERRHALLAGNVANSSTPGYQARDLSVENFQTKLADAIASIKQNEQSGMVSPGQLSNLRLSKAEPGESLEQVRDTMRDILYHDGSNDTMEQQVTEIAKNQGMHSMATTILRAHFRSLQMAISESVNA